MNNDLSLKRQELCSKIVEREVYYCVSSLMSGIARIMWEPSFHDAFDVYADDLMPLFRSEDFEEPGREFIRNDADIEQLEEIAENFGYYSDVLSQIGYENYVEMQSELGNDDPDSVETWLDGQDAALEEGRPSFWAALRERVAALVDDWEWVCREYDLDPDEHEVYEHWLVSSWLSSKLSERGYTVGEFAGLTIWGRGTTGQSISLDHVIEQIAEELWPEEWHGR